MKPQTKKIQRASVKNNYFSYFLLAGLFLILLQACSKSSGTTDDGTLNGNGGGGNNNVVDTIPPEIVITTPTATQTFRSGIPITISGRITDDIGMYRGSIRVYNDVSNLLLVQQLYEAHYLLAYNYSYNYTPGVSTSTVLRIVVSFEDHGGNSTTRTVKVTVDP